jgi:hypothetical protein
VDLVVRFTFWRMREAVEALAHIRASGGQPHANAGWSRVLRLDQIAQEPRARPSDLAGKFYNWTGERQISGKLSRKSNGIPLRMVFAYSRRRS